MGARRLGDLLLLLPKEGPTATGGPNCGFFPLAISLSASGAATLLLLGRVVFVINTCGGGLVPRAEGGGSSCLSKEDVTSSASLGELPPQRPALAAWFLPGVLAAVGRGGPREVVPVTSSVKELPSDGSIDSTGTGMHAGDFAVLVALLAPCVLGPQDAKGDDRWAAGEAAACDENGVGVEDTGTLPGRNSRDASGATNGGAA